MARLCALLAAAVLAAGCGSGSGDGETTGGLPATCEPESFLATLRDAIDDEEINLRIERVEVLRCRGGYAEVLAVPDNADCRPGVGFCYDSARVFLEEADGRWYVLDVGTGVDCADPDLTDDLRAACDALAGVR